MTTMRFVGAAAGTIDLNDNVNCQVARPGWEPKVAKRVQRRLGGDVYENVVEKIPLRVFSEHATPATARQAVTEWLHNMTAALDQAQAWRLGVGNVDALVFEYAPDDSVLTDPLKAVVVGVPENAAGLFEFQGSYNIGLRVYEVFIELEFERRGLWLGDEESEVVTENSTDAIITVTFGSEAFCASPISVQIVGDDVDGSNVMLSAGLLAVSDLDDGIVVADTYTGPGTVISSDRSMGGECYEVTPSSVTTYSRDLLLDGGAITLNPRRPELFEVFLVGRNLSDTVSWQVTGQLYGDSSATQGDLGAVRIIPAGVAAFVVRLGTLSCASSLEYVKVRLVPSETDTDALHVDYAVLCKVGTQIISFPNATEMSSVKTLRVIQGQLDGDGIGSGSKTNSQVMPRTESVYYTGTAVRFPTAHGNKSLWMQGDTVQVMLFGWASARVVGMTGYTNVTNPVISRTVTVARREGYLVPR